MIAAAFISDREDRYLPACLESLHKQPQTKLISSTVVIDDRAHRLGMAGAVRAAWDWALDTGCEYLLHVEEDFLFHDLPLAKMQQVLDGNPVLAQCVLKRQPWSSEEVGAGGIIEKDPDDYIERTAASAEGLWWVEHHRIFSLNPCLIPRSVLKLGWPDDNEAGFTAKCLSQGLSFAFYGRAGDAPRVEHVGDVRGAGWRL